MGAQRGKAACCQGGLHADACSGAGKPPNIIHPMRFLNVSAYKFVELGGLPALREDLRARCAAAALKGTVLIAPEGINLFLAGREGPLREVLAWFEADPRFTALPVKESWSDHQPFNRMLVKIKREIITMRQPQIRPAGARAPVVAPAVLKRWLDAGCDDAGREVVLLDTRNAFEVDIGSFEGAIDPQIRSFGEFPARVGELKAGLADKTVVTFCTGGIRCEKAVIYMQAEGFPHVVQLDGGILRYFEEVGGAHYRGDCFVFDRRVALTPELDEAGYAECFHCRAVVSPQEQREPVYVVGKSCPHCAT
jgi:UPF0176 protein